ncbi:MAG TPA: glycosyltransferase family 1 protein [Thermoanaerobaculia bacterium]|nr:glycosyltransferase family 1 protein [Thermoanaerobaculia bacterium]
MSLLPTLGVVLHTLGHAALDRLRRTFRRAVTRERKLRVGVDIRPFYEPLTGIGWYLHYLLHELARRDDVELVLFGDARITDEGPHLHANLPPSAELQVFDLRGLPKSRLARPLTAGAYVLLMELAGCDVVFGANYFLPRLMSAIARRRVVTVHDLTYKRFPELLQQETLDNLERQMTREVALADAVICVSSATRDDLLRYYTIDPARVVAIHSGLGTPPVESPIELPPRYILFVSTIEPRKNLGVLLDAFARLRARGVYDGELVVVGRVGWKADSLSARLKAPGVRHLDYVDASRLAYIYRNAEAFVFPSIFEGFGFPLLEAMARGVPSIAARSSSLPEIGGDAALYFAPTSSSELEAQLERVLTDAALREELARKGREQAAKFRWDAAAEQTLDVLRRAVSS